MSDGPRLGFRRSGPQVPHCLKHARVLSACDATLALSPDSRLGAAAQWLEPCSSMKWKASSTVREEACDDVSEFDSAFVNW